MWGSASTGRLRVEDAPISHISEDPLGNLLDRQQQIDKPGRDCVLRHLGEARPRQVRALGYGQPATFLDRLEAKGAVAATAREHNADRTLFLILGERLEKDVDRGPLSAAPVR